MIENIKKNIIPFISSVIFTVFMVFVPDVSCSPFRVGFFLILLLAAGADICFYILFCKEIDLRHFIFSDLSYFVLPFCVLTVVSCILAIIVYRIDLKPDVTQWNLYSHFASFTGRKRGLI